MGSVNGHGGKIACVVIAKESNVREAHFTAECGETYSYTVKLEGRSKDREVLFGRRVDLGEKGRDFDLDRQSLRKRIRRFL
jgi:hypothetical protein